MQPSLTISNPGDPFELEADRVADEVMRMPAGDESALEISRLAESPSIHRNCPSCATGDGDLSSVVARGIGGGGQSLDDGTRAFMESRFGHDFNHVRVHTATSAAESARSIDALAYTVERDVVFAPGKYAPHSNEGRRLLAHELTHVVQQSGRGTEAFIRGGENMIQRYGHANSCKGQDHLIPYIWPGHAQAKACVKSAIDATDGRPLAADTDKNLLTFFGTDSTNATNLLKINANFRKISAALDAQYLYHCSKKGDSSDKDAATCKGQNAETSPSGNMDVTLCFDNLSKWSVPWATWLIIHENVHRGLNVWGHSWEAGSLDKCIFNNGALRTSKLDLENADSYACFAVLLCLKSGSQDGGKEVQRFATSNVGPSSVPPVVNSVLSSAGRPLDHTTRALFEPRFGRDLGQVRVHTGGDAAASARSINALAYTVGSDIVFAAGRYAPQTSSGRKLLAHELTHVVQQDASAATPAVLQRDLATPPPTVAAQAQPDLTDAQIRDAINFNSQFYDAANTRLIQNLLGGQITGRWTADNIRAIAATQEEYGLKKDGKVGSETFRFINQEQTAEGVGTDTPNCLTAFRVVVFPLVDNSATPGPSGTVHIEGHHRIEAEFSPRCNCAEFEYRQFIAGTAAASLGATTRDLSSGFSLLPAGRLTVTEQEDGITTCPSVNYGHRSNPGQRPGSATCPEDWYFDANRTQNQTGGCHYRADDRPDDTTTGLPSGTTVDMLVQYRGEIRRNGTPVSTRRWTTIDTSVTVP